MLFSFFSFDFLPFIFIEPVNSGTLLVVTEVLGEFWRDLTCRTWPCDAQTERGEATGLGLAFMSPATQEQGSATSVVVQHVPMINGCRQRNAPLPYRSSAGWRPEDLAQFASERGGLCRCPEWY